MKKIYKILIILFALAVISYTIYSVVNKEGFIQKDSLNIEKNIGLVFDEESFDFGVIKQSGGKVSHDFSFTYQGDNPIKITGVPTSCACTSATVSPTNLNPGDSGVLTIKFNPNLHAEPEGKFFKTALILSEPELNNSPEIKIWVEIDLDLGEEAFELKSSHDDDEEDEEETSIYKPIMAEKFDEMLQQKDFVLIDVHIPEQEHIAGTDLLIPYNQIEDYEDQLPKDKDAKIVLYCRSGGMSRAAAYILEEHGYTNIYDLVGGKNAYDDFLKTK